MVVGRGFGGLAMGMTFVSVPNYVSEISPDNHRGFLATFLQICVNVGILLAYAFGRYVNFEYLALISCVPAAAMVVSMLSLPESPRFLVAKHKKQEARLALIKFRGTDLVHQELERMHENIILPSGTSSSSSSNGNSTNSFLKIFSQPKLRKAFILASSMLVLQQLSGINIVVFYTEEIYKQAGIVDTNLASIYVALANIGMTLVSSKLVDKAGRKILLTISSFGMGFFLAVFSFYFYKIEGLAADEISNFYKIIGVGCPVGFIIAFAIGLGPIPWMYAGEILPGSIKDQACAVGNFLGWLVSFLVLLGFSAFMVPTFHTYGSFLIFAGVCIASGVYCKVYVVETKNKSLEEIERLL